MSRPFTVAIVGCGWAGQRHARAFRARGAAVRWAIDTNEQRAAAIAEGEENCGVSVDLHVALDDPELDAIDICLPHNLHAEVAIEAAASAKHVLCEKPLAVSLEEADRMIAAADARGMILMVAENVVFSPLYQLARDLLSSGAIGKPALVQVSRACYLEDSFTQERPWFMDEKAAGGGMMMSGGIHDFQKLRMIVGEITSVYARRAPQRFSGMQGDDTSVALLEFQNGATGIMVESYMMKSAVTVSGTEEHTLRVDGETGSIRVVSDTSSTITVFRDRVDDPDLSGAVIDSQVVVPEVDTFDLEVAHFIDCARSGKEPLTSGRKMRRPLELVLAAYRSMQERKEVLVP